MGEKIIQSIRVILDWLTLPTTNGGLPGWAVVICVLLIALALGDVGFFWYDIAAAPVPIHLTPTPSLAPF